MIRLTKQSDYGIVLMTYMALDPERLYTATELAEENHLPLPMVSKILKILARGELLASHRGAKGGYSLVRKPGAISLFEIVSAVEGPIGLTECVDDVAGSCTCEPVCLVRDNWQRINLAIRRALDSIHLDEMTRPLSGSDPQGPAWLEKPGLLVSLSGSSNGPAEGAGNADEPTA